MLHYSHKVKMVPNRSFEKVCLTCLEVDERKLANPCGTRDCPFCGITPRYLENKPGYYTERIICDNCGFHLPFIKWQRRI